MKELKGIQVKPRPNEPINTVVKRFTRVVRNSGVLDEWRRRQSFEKPSVKRRRKAAEARWRSRKNED